MRGFWVLEDSGNHWYLNLSDFQVNHCVISQFHFINLSHSGNKNGHPEIKSGNTSCYSNWAGYNRMQNNKFQPISQPVRIIDGILQSYSSSFNWAERKRLAFKINLKPDSTTLFTRKYFQKHSFKHSFSFDSNSFSRLANLTAPSTHFFSCYTEGLKLKLTCRLDIRYQASSKIAWNCRSIFWLLQVRFMQHLLLL